MSSIQVLSEIGKLKQVMLHRPGREVENLIPDYLERLLFDDIPYLKIARQEHDRFAEILRENGAEVLYLEDMLAEVFADAEIKAAFLQEMLEESDVHSTYRRDALFEHLMALPVPQMIDDIMSGIRKGQVEYSGDSLFDILKCDYEFYLDPMPNLYFTRDPGACMGNGLTINTMTTRARKRETLFLKYLHLHHKVFKDAPLWYNRDMPHSIEGGDELVLSDKVVAIGASDRTSAAAIERVAKNLFKSDSTYEKVLVFEIQKRRAYMHLDTVFTMVDHDKFTVHPGIYSDLNIYEMYKTAGGRYSVRYIGNSAKKALEETLNIDHIDLIECGGGDAIISHREQWNDGSNTLAVAPGVVVTYERNYVSNELLDKKGVKVLTMPSSELSRGRGGPRCMSMPINREKL
ncbi:MAG: arginine deiminase [Defluviitaleaceae bacterium]|nr:arginine deiminase [Defluviitaleaceae bacterium]